MGWGKTTTANHFECNVQSIKRILEHQKRLKFVNPDGKLAFKTEIYLESLRFLWYTKLAGLCPFLSASLYRIVSYRIVSYRMSVPHIF